jgi:ABC-type multidrug transport system ATPase subunit
MTSATEGELAVRVEAAIRLVGLTRRFGRVEALRGIDLEIAPGSIYALVGPNGAGKSTLIKILMNILRATSGSAELLGLDSQRLTGAALNRIGYVSENQKMPEWMTVGSMLAYLRPFYPTWDRGLEDELVKQFDLPVDRKLKGLSRGMRMKAALASALAFHPRMIVLDEPFSGLDPLVRDELVEGLLDRAEEATILISSHDLAEIEGFSSHVGYLERGSLLFSEEMESLLERFREVRVTMAGEGGLVEDGLPSSWLQVSNAGGVVRFVESRFEEERTRTEIGAVFAGAETVKIAPMSLREIFLAMAKTGRSQAAESEGAR